jgi:hypothetical protein
MVLRYSYFTAMLINVGILLLQQLKPRIQRVSHRLPADIKKAN